MTTATALKHGACSVCGKSFKKNEARKYCGDLLCWVCSTWLQLIEVGW